jgi:hypothetical protein
MVNPGGTTTPFASATTLILSLCAWVSVGNKTPLSLLSMCNIDEKSTLVVLIPT